MEPVSIRRRLFNGWMAITARFGFIQTRVILAFFYAMLIGPTSLILAVTGRDLLDKRHLGAKETAWQEPDSAKPDLERAKRMS